MRITDSIRRQIIGNALDATFKQRGELLREEEHALAQEVYNTAYPERIRETMKSLPEDFFYQQSRVVIVKTENGKSRWALNLGMKSSMLVGAQHQYQAVGVEDNEELIKKGMLFKAKHEKYESDVSELRSKLNIFLAGINTSKQLKERWPEGAEYYDEEIAEPTENLPAVQAQVVNDLLAQMKVSK